MTTTLLFADGVWEFNPHPRAAAIEWLPDGPDAGVDYLTSDDAIGTIGKIGRTVEPDVGIIVFTLPYVGPLVLDPYTSCYVSASWTYRTDGVGQQLDTVFIDTRTYEGLVDFDADAGVLLQGSIQDKQPYEFGTTGAGNANAGMQAAYDDGCLALLLSFHSSIGDAFANLSYLVVSVVSVDPVGGMSPPLRIFPRDDALTGGARRTYPPSKTQQRGIRRGPGSYL